MRSTVGDVTDTMMPPAAALRGTVATADGTAVEGAFVLATVGAARPRINDGIFQARTDARGQYQIADLIPFSQDELAAPGRPVGYGIVKWSNFPQYPLTPVGDENRINITVEHPDFAVRHTRCKRIPGELNVNLEPTASVSGRVAGIAGAPVAGALVNLENGENWLQVEDEVQRAYYGSARTDSEGRYSFRNLPTGVYISSARVGR